MAVLDSHGSAPTPFEVDIEIASAMGAVCFTMAGTRMPDGEGATVRLVGLMRDTTERSREMRRLSYLATRDELTGHLNRNALREELSTAIESAKAETRHCAFLVASIDRLAMINDSFGFDAGDEVIVGVGERLARTLRGTDVIGRTAGNKFGVILKNCSDREMAVVASRLRASVRANMVETRGGVVAATCSVGAVWLPQAASTSQEAMLRAEQALDKARTYGRDGFAVYQPTPPARNRASAPDADRRRGDAGAEGQSPASWPISPSCRRARARCRITNACCAWPSRTAPSSPPAISCPPAEQMGIVHLVDRFALEATVAQLKANRNVTLAVNVSGTAASDPAWLQNFVDYVRTEQVDRQTPDRGADGNRRPASFRGKCPLRVTACASWASASRSTISAPAIPRSATCRCCMSIPSRSTVPM